MSVTATYPAAESLERGMPLSPLEASIIGAIEPRLEVARVVIGMINGENDQSVIATTLAETGAYKTKDSARRGIKTVMDNINEASLGSGNGSLIVKDGPHSSYSANPRLAETFVSIRRHLGFDQDDDVDPTAFMSSKYAEEFALLIGDDAERATFFLETMDRANAFLDIPLAKRFLRKHAPYEFDTDLPKSTLSATFDAVSQVAKSGTAVKGVVATTKKALLAVHAPVTESTVQKADESAELWFGQELFIYDTSAKGNNERLSGIRVGTLAILEKRIAESKKLNSGQRVTPEDRRDFWKYSGAVSDFISKRTNVVPIPGDMPLKAALCIYARMCVLEENPKLNPQIWQRVDVLKEAYQRYIIFFGLKPETPNKSISDGKRPVYYKKNLARAACRGLEPAMFNPSEDDKEATREALRVCMSCPVREACLEEAIENGTKEGIWGGTTPRQRRGMIRRENKRKAAERAAAERAAEAAAKAAAHHDEEIVASA